jgi:hypothetical protein
VRRIFRYLPLLSLPFFCLRPANAQSAFDMNVGFGTEHAKAAGGGIDNQTFASCTTGPTCQLTPALSGFFLGFGGDIMLQKHYGIGADVNVHPAKSDYGPLQYRETFYDINGIYAPVNEKKAVLQLIGGLGGAKTSFSFTQTGCVGTAVCSTQSQPVGNSNHFALHAGAAVQVFVSEHVYIKPQFDYHYVTNLTDQFGSKSVIGAMVWLGYSFGDR